MAIGNLYNKLCFITMSQVFKSNPFFFYLYLRLKRLKLGVNYFLCFCCTFMKECVLNIQFSTIVLILVLLSGDVAENPGPSQSGSTSESCLSLVHLNIRSIRYKLGYVKNFLLDLNVLCFTETHLTQDI